METKVYYLRIGQPVFENGKKVWTELHDHSFSAFGQNDLIERIQNHFGVKLNHRCIHNLFNGKVGSVDETISLSFIR